MYNTLIIGPRHAGVYTAADGTKRVLSMRSELNKIKKRSLCEKQRVLVAQIHMTWQKQGLAK